MNNKIKETINYLVEEYYKLNDLETKLKGGDELEALIDKKIAINKTIAELKSLNETLGGK